MAGQISKSIRSAMRKAEKRIKAINKLHGRNIMTDEKSDMMRVHLILQKALKVLKIENYYY